MTRSRATLSPLILLALVACSGSPTNTAVDSYTEATNEGSTTTVSSLPTMYSLFSSNVDVFLSGSTIVIRTDDLPSHPSPYYGQGHPLYTAPAAGMVVNPNSILAQNYELRIPASPLATAAGSATGLDAIGVAVNGVVMFNQYAAGFSALDNELATFDQYNGHPAQRGNYHYHIEPVAITAADSSALVGVLLDGFPVYGPLDQGGTTPTDLDECNGHVGATRDAPAGVYHYHITSGFPYISGCYRGTPGSVSN